jgi:hypothetical protein
MGGAVAAPEQRAGSVVPVPEKNGGASPLSLTEISDYQIVLPEYLVVGAKISFSVWVNSEMQYIEQIGIICK